MISINKFMSFFLVKIFLLLDKTGQASKIHLDNNRQFFVVVIVATLPKTKQIKKGGNGFYNHICCLDLRCGVSLVSLILFRLTLTFSDNHCYIYVHFEIRFFFGNFNQFIGNKTFRISYLSYRFDRFDPP